MNAKHSGRERHTISLTKAARITCVVETHAGGLAVRSGLAAQCSAIATDVITIMRFQKESRQAALLGEDIQCTWHPIEWLSRSTPSFQAESRTPTSEVCW
jgi:hypothetical protein